MLKEGKKEEGRRKKERMVERKVEFLRSFIFWNIMP
jgi:hypothetical protein